MKSFFLLFTLLLLGSKLWAQFSSSYLIKNVLYSSENNTIWITDNSHSYVRGISTIYGSQVAKLPHVYPILDIHETEEYIITVNNKVRFWRKPDFNLVDSIDLYLVENTVIDGNKQLAAIGANEISLIDLKTKKIQKVKCPPDFHLYRLKFSPDGSLFVRNNHDIFRLTSTSLERIYSTQRNINQWDINENGVFLLTSDNQFDASENTEIIQLDFEGKQVESFVLDEVNHLKTQSGSVNSFEISPYPFFKVVGKECLIQSKKGVFIATKEWKRVLIDGFIGDDFDILSRFYFQDNFIIRTSNEKLSILDEFANPHFEKRMDYPIGHFRYSDEYGLSMMFGNFIVFAKEDGKPKQINFDLEKEFLPLTAVNHNEQLTFHLNGEVIVWDRETFKQKSTWKLKGNLKPLSVVASSENQNAYLIFPYSKKISVYNFKGKKIQSKHLDFEGYPSSIALFNHHILIGTTKGGLYKLGYDLRVIEEHKGLFAESISVIQGLESTKELLLGSNGRFAKCNWDVEKIKDEDVYKVHTGYITDFSVQRFDGVDYLLSSARGDKNAYLWNLNSASLLKSFPHDKNIIQSSLEDSLHVLSLHEDMSINQYENLDLLRSISAHKPQTYFQSPISTGIRKIEFSKDQNKVLVIAGNIVHVIDMKTRKIISSFGDKDEFINDAIFDDNTRSVIITRGTNLLHFDISTGLQIRELDYKYVPNVSIHKIVATPNYNFIVGLNTHGWSNPYLLHANSGRFYGKLFFPIEGNYIYDLQFSTSGNLMALYTNNEVMVLKDYLNNKPEVVFNYKRTGNSNYTGHSCLAIDEERNLISFVDKYENRTSVVTYDYIENKQKKVVDLSYIFTLKQGAVLFADQDKLKEQDTDRRVRKTYQPKEKFLQKINAVGYNSKYDVAVGGDNWGNLKFFDGKSGQEISSFSRFRHDIYEFSVKNNILLYNHKQGLFYFDKERFENRRVDNASNYPFFTDQSEDGNSLIYLEDVEKHKKPRVFKYNIKLNQSETLFTLPIKKGLLKNILLRGNKVFYHYLSDNKFNISFYDINTKEHQEIVKIEKAATQLNPYSSSEMLFFDKFEYLKTRFVISSFQYDLNSKKKNKLNELEFPLSSNKELDKMRMSNYIENYHLYPSKNYHLYLLASGLQLYDYQKKTFIFKDYNPFIFEKCRYDPTTNKVFILDKTQNFHVLDPTDMSLKRVFQSENKVSQFTIGEDKIYILTEADNIFVYSLSDYSFLYKLQTSGEDGISVIDDEGYYLSNKEAIESITFKNTNSNEIYRFDQFDPWFNRPDIVLKKIGVSDIRYINQAHKAWEKRLEKLSVGKNYPVLQSLPTLSINKEELPVSTKESEVTILVKSSADEKITAVDVWVNNVPIFGQEGWTVQNPAESVTEEVTVSLGNGKNNVEVSVRTEQNQSSLKEEVFINCEKETVKSKFYLISIGISNYVDQTMNLKYADKDAKDIVDDLSKKSDVKLVPILLTNEQVTKENILALKAQLLNTTVDDKVMIYYAGHGILDTDYNYYLSTYSLDFTHPQNDGLRYEDLVDLLDGIPSRKKVIIIDACHSGELDKSAEKLVAQNDVKVVSTYSRGLVPKLPLPTTSSFNFMQSLFVDLRRGTGATIISSAGGDELASEGGIYNNGLFTYYLRKSINEEVADSNSDYKVTLDEILEYVSKQVTVQSKGRQAPNARRWNKEGNFVLWEVDPEN
ncbi:caspase family protein [Flammeovirga sp. EKP202]|uniref:caspase family protein n=1 Tax=Flammeovirga sp. EKP202 TaxID=2770592 RepID=UPI00165EFC6A|nr:caspase family protein [Flammeovirga sp. EKP202]MBD0403718.1 caspase family protein [Flammeovirga sp. EKP202]